MLNQTFFYSELKKNGVTFFTGVPDSYLNGFCNYLMENAAGNEHIIAANEGNAVGIAAGHYFATGTLPLLYMQNSGMGNAVNPLASLADKNVYSVPMIWLIGWRGQPGTGDWAQHQLQGEITAKLPEILNIPYDILSNDEEKTAKQLAWACQTAMQNRCPVALIAPKGVLAGEKKPTPPDTCYPMSREEAIEAVLDCMPADTIYSATTGRATRELYFLRERRNESHACDFLNVGSMGHASSVALGIALAKPARPVVTFDGDCACMMHMGALTMVSKLNVPNFLHIVLNNGAHESVGGQPSAGFLVDFTAIAKASGYATLDHAVTEKEEIAAAVDILRKAGKAAFLEIRIHKGLRGKLPPLDISHEGLITGLMNELQGKECE
ncbi:MAG: phosphonopyruvate decarboxylase [Oscillospiraceae bacterium]|nr:phosphonopyruvate decarboxylase [Oscillospiraceae bacterium]